MLFVAPLALLTPPAEVLLISPKLSMKAAVRADTVVAPSAVRASVAAVVADGAPVAETNASPPPTVRHRKNAGRFHRDKNPRCATTEDPFPLLWKRRGWLPAAHTALRLYCNIHAMSFSESES